MKAKLSSMKLWFCLFTMLLAGAIEIVNKGLSPVCGWLLFGICVTFCFFNEVKKIINQETICKILEAITLFKTIKAAEYVPPSPTIQNGGNDEERP